MSKLWGYRIPNLNDPYVYLSSLLTDPYSPSKKVANWASYLLEIDMYSSPAILEQRRVDAFAFLKQVADQQKAHELAFIKQRIQDLRQLGLDKGEEVQKLYEALENMQSGSNIDYKQFIKGLNSVINTLEKYKTRVEAFNTTAISNIPQVRMVENLATTIGSYADSRYAIYYSQEEAIRQLALKWLSTTGKDFVAEQIADGINGGKNIAAMLALVTQQMSRYIYDTRQLKERHVAKSDKKGKFVDFSSVEQFTNFINKVDLDKFESYTNMSKALKDKQLLQEVQRMYGIDYDKYITSNGRRLSTKAKKEIQEVKSILKNEPLITDNFKKIMNHITVKWRGHNKSEHKLAIQNELISALSSAFGSHKHLGSLNMGTDMLLGYIGVDVNFEDDNGEISNTLNTIAERLRSESAINDVEKSSEIYLDEMIKLNDALSKLRDGFIIHETNKNYNTLERGKWPTGMNSFEGRNMQLLNYVSTIHSMGAIEGIDTRWLEFACLNLATDALGAILKEPLEHLLAIFGGMIMFDDFSIIGKEITENMSFSNLQNLHLYKLQDIYIPASTFLYATYDAFQSLGQELFEGNGFTANIKVPTIDYEKNFKKRGAFATRWIPVREAAEKGTEIHLHFAANFFNLMSKLL